MHPLMDFLNVCVFDFLKHTSSKKRRRESKREVEEKQDKEEGRSRIGGRKVEGLEDEEVVIHSREAAL